MNVLFVCTANACRSQMAEAWAHRLFPEGWTVASAGLLTYPVSRRARAVMAEVGIDMAGQHSKTIEEVELGGFDLVVTLSEEAGRYLPALGPGQRHLAHPVTDPMGATGPPDEVRAAFRTGRDTIEKIVSAVVAGEGDDA